MGARLWHACVMTAAAAHLMLVAALAATGHGWLAAGGVLAFVFVVTYRYAGGSHE